MNERKPFRRKAQTHVVAIQLSLDTEGLIYEKWGGRQLAKPGDWLVDNAGDVYTVDQDSFSQSYRRVSQGIFKKTSNIWACQALKAGTVSTKEGHTAYQAGDYLVSNDQAGSDAYAISAKKFHSLYEPVNDDDE